MIGEQTTEVSAPSPITLRDYQRECVSLVLDAYRRFRAGQLEERFQLVVLPTGSGKTVIFSSVIHTLAREHGLNALIIAHRDELLDQAAEKYRMVRPDAVIGKVGSGLHQYGGEVTVASIATISRPEHLKRLRAIGYGLIIIDEAHHSAAAGYQRVLNALPESFVLGVTATPMRLDGKPILQASRKPLYQRTIRDMIEAGYLADIQAIAIRTEVSLDEVRTLAGDYNERELDDAVNTPERNRRIVAAYLEHTEGKRAVAFCVTVRHAEALAYAFNDQGVPAALIAGDTPLDERKRLYAAFQRGEIKVLTNCMVLTEGWDSPLAEVAILARPTQSQALYIQMAGRVLRPAPTKKHAIFLDITDNSKRLRLQPQNVHRALGVRLRHHESLLEAVEREEREKSEREAEEKRALIRKLNERRTSDQFVDPFALPDWQERDNGLFVIEVGAQKHRLALVPCKGDGKDGLYEVWARLAPTFKAQRWAAATPLDWAMQYAEKRAHELLATPGAVRLYDKEAPWRARPISEGQQKMLRWYRIPVREGMTQGEASDLIDAHKQAIEQRKKAKAEREAAKRAALDQGNEADGPAGHLHSAEGFSLMRS
jgi:superfamily II DNA or RNA helicase